MQFDSYIVQNVEIAQTIPLNCLPPTSQYSTSNKGFRFFKRHARRAFTLAETLITLTIIGVIAAMTIPTLVSKYQKHSYVTGLKKAYSTLSNAMTLAMHDDEVWEYWNGDISCYGSTNNIIKKYMKVVKTCDSNNWEECVEVNENGRPIQGVYGNDDIFVTADGMTWSSSFSVDINGKKGPNRWGRDIFWFEMAEYNQNGVAQGTVMPYGSKLMTKYRGYDDYYWNNNPSSPKCTTEIVNRYGKNSGWSGAVYCTGRVLEEGAMNY